MTLREKHYKLYLENKLLKEKTNFLEENLESTKRSLQASYRAISNMADEIVILKVKLKE